MAQILSISNVVAHKLVLTRGPGESVIIETPAGEVIEITVAAVRGNQVQLGTEAPAYMTILREELVRRSQTAQNE